MVTLPTRVEGSAHQRGAVRLPGAGDVPQVRVASDPGVNAPSAAFGGAEQGELASFGDTISQVGEVQASRQEAYDISRALVDYNNEAEAHLRDVNAEQDLSNSSVMSEYGAWLTTRQTEALNSFSGRPSARKRLEAQLAELNGRYVGNAAAMSVEAGLAHIGSAINLRLTPLVAAASAGPSQIDDLLRQADALKADIASALPPQQEAAQGRAIYGQIATAAINGMMATGNIEGAAALLPKLEKALGPEGVAQARIKVISAQVAQDQATRELQGKIRAIESIAGPLTKEQKLNLLGLKPPSGTGLAAKIAATEGALGRKLTEPEIQKIAGIDDTRQTLADKVSEFERVTGRDATDQEISKIAGAYIASGGDDGGFGKGLTGRALQTMVELAPLYAAGTTTPDQERILDAAITEYTQQQKFEDPDTGQITYHQNRLPGFVAEALKERQTLGANPMTYKPPSAEQTAGLIELDEFGMPKAIRNEPMPPPEQFQGLLEKDPVTGMAKGVTAQPQAPLTANQGSMTNLQSRIPLIEVPTPPKSEITADPVFEGPARGPGGRTIYQMSGDVTGPGPAIIEGASRIPGVSSLVEGPETSRIVQSRAFLSQAQRDLTTVLQNNPRYAEGERKQIDADIQINPSLIDTPQAYRDRLIGIDDALKVRQDTAYKYATGQSGPVSGEARRHAMNVLQAIIRFREVLGVPPTFNSVAEVEKAIGEGLLGPEDQFRDPDGNVWYARHVGQQ